MKNHKKIKNLFGLVLILAVISIAAVIMFQAPISYASHTPGHVDPPPPRPASSPSTNQGNIPPPETFDCGNGWIFPNTSPACIAYQLAYTLIKVLIIFVNLSSRLFDFVFEQLNLKFNSPNSIFAAFISAGWGTAQGAANMFFILILLWIAFATIFDLPNYTAKKLLPRLIVMALLVNFSLAITNLVIDFSNSIANVFWAPLKPAVGDKILNTVSFQNLILKPPPVPALAQTDLKALAESLRLSTNKYKACVKADPNADCSAEFDTKENIEKTIGFKADQKKGAESAFDKALITLVMMIPFLLVVVFVLLVATIMFIARPITLALLSVLSPIVFLLNILPDTQQHWNKWWSKLIEQSFFAPAFVFLLYLSLTSLGPALSSITRQDASSGEIAIASVKVVMTFILFMILLIANLMIARQMGGALGAMGEKYAQKGIGQIRGAAARGGARIAAPYADRFLKSEFGAFTARMPLVRAFPKAMTKIREMEEKRAKEKAEFYSKISPEAFASELGKTTKTEQEQYIKLADAEKRQKIVSELTKKGQLKSLAPDMMRSLNAGTKEFNPEAELAAKGIYSDSRDYERQMDALLTDRIRDVGKIRLDSLKENAVVQRSIKRVANGKDLEKIAGTGKGAEAVRDLLSEEVREINDQISRGIYESTGEVLKRKYNNDDLARYAASNPLWQKLVLGQIVRPKGKTRGKKT